MSGGLQIHEDTEFVGNRTDSPFQDPIYAGERATATAEVEFS